MLIPFCFTINPYDIQHESLWLPWICRVAMATSEGILISCIGQFFAGLTVVREPQFFWGVTLGVRGGPPPKIPWSTRTRTCDHEVEVVIFVPLNSSIDLMGEIFCHYKMGPYLLQMDCTWPYTWVSLGLGHPISGVLGPLLITIIGATFCKDTMFFSDSIDEALRPLSRAGNCPWWPVPLPLSWFGRGIAWARTEEWLGIWGGDEMMMMTMTMTTMTMMMI